MSEEEEVTSNEEEEVNNRERVEDEEDSGFMFTSIEDIELLVKNTEVWDNLLQGKISIEQAKKSFEENLTLVLKSDRGKKRGGRKSKATKKEKKGKRKKKMEEEEEEENV